MRVLCKNNVVLSIETMFRKEYTYYTSIPVMGKNEDCKKRRNSLQLSTNRIKSPS